MGRESRQEKAPLHKSKTKQTCYCDHCPISIHTTKCLTAWLVNQVTFPWTAACWMGGRMLMVFSHLTRNSSQIAGCKPWASPTLASNLCSVIVIQKQTKGSAHYHFSAGTCHASPLPSSRFFQLKMKIMMQKSLAQTVRVFRWVL